MSTGKLVLAVSFLTFGLAAPLPSAAAGFGLNSLYGCDAPGSANTTGTVVGGLVGALAGSQVSKNERALGAVIGAGVGSAIGNQIGCRMDRKARADAQTAFQRALETGKSQSWSDPQSGASGTIRVLGPGATVGSGPTHPGRWRYAEGVSSAQWVGGAEGDYVASARTNVRAAPNNNAAVVDRLQAGERVSIAGAVPNGWLAVVEDGLIRGYVSLSVVRPAPKEASEPTYGCRLVEQTVSMPDQQPYSERFNACRDANGEWRLEAV
jgi:surface antigen